MILFSNRKLAQVLIGLLLYGKYYLAIVQSYYFYLANFVPIPLEESNICAKTAKTSRILSRYPFKAQVHTGFIERSKTFSSL